MRHSPLSDHNTSALWWRKEALKVIFDEGCSELQKKKKEKRKKERKERKKVEKEKRIKGERDRREGINEETTTSGWRYKEWS